VRISDGALERFRFPAILEQDSQPSGVLFPDLCVYKSFNQCIYSFKNVFKASPKIQTTTAQDRNEAILTRLFFSRGECQCSLDSLFFFSIHGKVGVVFCEMRVCVLFLISRKGVFRAWMRECPYNHVLIYVNVHM